MSNLVELQIQQPDNAAQTKAEAALERAESLTITDAATYEGATEDLKAIKAKYREIEAERKALKQPIDEAARRVQSFFKPPLDFLTKAEGVIKRKLSDYSREQQRIQQEAQRKADEAARKERERLAARARKAEESGKAEKAEQLAQQAETVTAPVVARETPKVQGVSTRKVWKFRIKDRAKVPEQYKTIDERKIGGVVRSLGGDADIPGVEVYEEDVIAARA